MKILIELNLEQRLSLMLLKISVPVSDGLKKLTNSGTVENTRRLDKRELNGLDY
jgi:hypothetical protein